MVEQLSATWFSSAEGLLVSFIRAKTVLLQVIGQTEAEKERIRNELYGVSTSRTQKLEEDIFRPVRCLEFFE